MTVEERRPRHAVRGMDVPTSRPRFGCHLEASRSGHATGSIGKIDEANNDTGSSSVVVDTGPWIFGRKVVILAGGPGEPNVYVSFTKDEIKDLSDYDSYKFDEDYRTRLGDYYSSR